MNCKNCNAKIYNETDFKIGDDYFCDECFIYLTGFQDNSQEQDRQVTREMALDAGDPNMEGTWIKW
jgi:hypothetical protein